MKKPDARRLGEESLQLLRSQAHRLRLDGRTWAEIASIVGVSLGVMMVWARCYRLGSDEFSEENVVSLRRGRVQGANRTLSSDDEALLRHWIIQDRPATYGLPYALWTRRAVQELIRAKFDTDMPMRTVGEYLMRWGMTPKRPARRAREQDQTALKTWTNETYPEIVRRAKAQGGTVYWADETAIRQDTAWIRGYAPSCQTPQLLHSARWDSITMISALTNQGLVRFRPAALDKTGLKRMAEDFMRQLSSTPGRVARYFNCSMSDAFDCRVNKSILGVFIGAVRDIIIFEKKERLFFKSLSVSR